MDDILDSFLKVATKVLTVIGGVALTFMMLLTVADVLMRAAGHPIPGTYEIVGISLALVIGFGIPRVSLLKGHVFMEVFVGKLSGRGNAIVNTFTRVLCIALFLLIGYNLFCCAAEFRTAGEVSPTISLPFYPVAYGVGICCFIECLVFVADIIKMWRGHHE